MATRIETLGSGRRASRGAWFMLLAVVLIAAALAVGALIGSGTTAPDRSATDVSAVVAPATHVPGLIKGGLQPRPYSPIVVDESGTDVRVPDGFVRMKGGEVRPAFGS